MFLYPENFTTSNYAGASTEYHQKEQNKRNNSFQNNFHPPLQELHLCSDGYNTSSDSKLAREKLCFPLCLMNRKQQRMQ